MAGINIPFLSDVRNFLRGGEQVADKLDDVAESLDDVQDAGRDTGRSLDDAADQAGDAADRIERDFTDALDAVRASGRATGKSLGDEVTDGTRRAGDSIEDFKSESDQVGRELAAGFDGTAEGIGDAFQDVAANAFAGFGPAGAAAGLAAAIGIGIARAELEEYAEEINDAKEAGVEWARSFNAAGLDDRIANLRDAWGELTNEIRDSKEWYELGQENAVTAIEQIANAARAGVGDVGGFIEAFNVEEPERRLDALRRQLDVVNGQLGTTSDHWRAVLGGPEVEERFLDRQETLKDLGGIIEDQIAIQENANEVERAHAEALGLTVEQFRAQQEEIARTTEAQAAYGEALEELADPVSTYQDLLSEKEDAERRTAEATAEATARTTDSWEDYAKSVTVSTDELIEEWNRQAEEAAKFEENLAIIAAAGGQALADELRAKGPEVAGSVAEVIAEAGPKKRGAAIRAHARATGQEISQDMASGIKSRKRKVGDAVEGVVGDINPPRIPIGITTSDADYDVSVWRSRVASIPVTIGLRAV